MADTTLFLADGGVDDFYQPLHDVGNSLYSTLPLNPETWNLRVMDDEEHAIFEGDHYFVTNTVTLASDGVFAVGMVTPNTTSWAVFTWEFRTTGQMTASIFEDATFTSSDWTAVTPINSNRNSANTTAMTVVSTDAFNDTDGGTELAAYSLGLAANPANLSGGNARREDEIILKQNTQYVFKITSQTADNIISYSLKWFEHADKT